MKQSADVRSQTIEECAKIADIAAIGASCRPDRDVPVAMCKLIAGEIRALKNAAPTLLQGTVEQSKECTCGYENIAATKAISGGRHAPSCPMAFQPPFKTEWEGKDLFIKDSAGKLIYPHEIIEILNRSMQSAIEDRRDAERFRWLCAHWDDFSGYASKNPEKWLTETIDAGMNVGRSDRTTEEK